MLSISRPGVREAKKKIKNISSGLLESFGELITGKEISFMSAYELWKTAAELEIQEIAA